MPPAELDEVLTVPREMSQTLDDIAPESMTKRYLRSRGHARRDDVALSIENGLGV